MSSGFRYVSWAAISVAAFFPAAAQQRAEAVQPHVITIVGMAFAPASLRVHVGDTVQFENKDIVPHTATARAPGGFDSGMIKPGTTWSVVLKEAGTIHFACQFHTEMAGEIIVEK